ncbi:MAG TPA: Ig-like domain-containing protein [Candidatus Acidoferrales bacterium]|nr:Ig-like domain-containing protein [Candidatus Acidoferrales bacterium]
MANLNNTDTGAQITSSRGLSRRWGLALLCGVWLALLSPKVILGLPGANSANHQIQAGSVASANSSLQIAAGNSAPGALSISPAQINIAVGRKQSFRLIDQQGHPIHDATWMVSDFTVADLDSLDPPRIAAVAPGQVTVTAILGDQTVQAKVNVVNSSPLSSVRRRGGSSASGGQ